MKPLHKWNEALMSKHLWNIVANKDSIWVRWVNLQWIKGDSIWNVVIDQKNSSWCWKQFMGLRDKVKEFVGFKIGNGKRCSIWFDRWCDNGPLCKLINERVLYQANISIKAKVADMIRGERWKWPREWNSRFGEILNIPVPKLTDNVDDKAMWINRKGKEKTFSVKEAWKNMRCNSQKVIWFRHVWFSQCIPRHAFILWMAIKGKLKTQDRLSKWLNVTDMTCPLCNGCKDSHSHLFFGCVFSKRLWERLKVMAKLNDMYNTWGEVISGIVNKSARNNIWSNPKIGIGSCGVLHMERKEYEAVW